jgi:uncharacterized membrane protein
VSKTRYIAQAGVIAALYAALTVLVVQFGTIFAWGPLQFRVSEALTVLALFTPAAIPGLTLGSVIANAYGMTQTGAIGILDVVFGSLGTLLAALWMWRFRKRVGVALLGPIVANALIVPAYLPLILSTITGGLETYRWLGIDASHAYWAMYLFGVVTIGISEAVIVYGLGLPLLLTLRAVLPRGLMESDGSADDRGDGDA